MSWNYRLMKHRFGGEETLDLHEVHYDADGKIIGWSDPTSFGGETVDEVVEALKLAIEGCSQPVIDPEPKQ